MENKKHELSFSSLKNLSVGPLFFQAQLNKKYESTGVLNVGSIVDCLLTTPEQFNDRYVILKAKEPIGQLKAFSDYLVEGKTSEEAYELVGFKRTSLEKVIDSFINDAQEYYDERKECLNGHKTAISNENYIKGRQVYESLINNVFTAPYFKPLEHVEDLKQLDIIWEYEDIKIKSILDLVKIYHNTKEIDLCEIKTSGYHVDAFPESVEKYQYWLQMGMYCAALYQYIKNNRPDLMGYDVKLKWIVESTKYIGNPYVFRFKQLDQAWKGGFIGNKRVKGFSELISDYKWYVKNGWNYKREVVENGGEMELTLF